ncbi:MAG: hypothetical protein KDA45_12800, partial [Planctomycetales bacterium]|nr:hypothetical protein [Planctomycetales bacterium]
MRLPAVETQSVAALNTSSAGPLALPPDAPAAATPPVVAPPLPTAAAVAKSPGLPSGESVPLPAVEPPAERHTTAAATASPLAGGDPRRSWWEHWSSGIVLILLIIALVTASIIALNDSGKSVSEQLAQEDGHTLGSDFDLSNIHIPEIAAPANLTPTSPAAPSAPPVPALQASSAAQPSAEFSNAPLSAAG